MSIKQQTQKAAAEMSRPTESVGSPGQAGQGQTFDDKVFDPERHVAGPDGKGVKTLAGKYRLKPGVKKGSKPQARQPGQSSVGIDQQSGLARPTQEMEAIAAAQTIVNLNSVACIQFYGQQIGVQTPEELTFQTYSWVAFFQKHEIQNFSPELMILVSLGACHLPRLARSIPAQDKLKEVYRKLFRKGEPTDEMTPEAQTDKTSYTA